MHPKLKLKIYEALERVIEDNGEDEFLWCHLIHPELVTQMTNAAETVFDSAALSQEYYERESV